LLNHISYYIFIIVTTRLDQEFASLSERSFTSTFAKASVDKSFRMTPRSVISNEERNPTPGHSS